MVQKMKLGSSYHNGWVLANGVRTHYSWAGTEGPAVVLCHGGGPGSSGGAGWRFMLPALAEAGFRVYAPDQISMGWTDARPHAWPVLGHQSLVNHVSDFIDALCLDEVYLVGNSQGAYVAAKYTIDHPERVRKCFLIGSATIAMSMGLERPDGGNNAAFQALLHYDYTEEAMRKFLTAIINDPTKVTDELVRARHVAANRPGIRESMQAFQDYQSRMRREPQLWDRFSLKDSLPQLKVPTEFIWGIDDSFAPVEMGHELEKLLPNIPFSYIREAGHQCQTDQPELVNRMVIEFFLQE
ncbi:alpha/beta fold hydrolase [Paenibacillus validus]|uniref:Alpha/beta fold hydrolase n=2 Tax=Paenibacillus validus TaxID=44253 RepID=A0A7X2ZDA3_9BACL|nr:alpha/beta fold hydrolase [Paenibacillus validus]